MFMRVVTPKQLMEMIQARQARATSMAADMVFLEAPPALVRGEDMLSLIAEANRVQIAVGYLAVARDSEEIHPTYH